MSGPDDEAQCSNTSPSEPDDQQCADKSLTELLQEYEEKFKYRYTEQDSKYMEVVSKPLPPPPVVYPWFVQNRRSFDRRDNRQERYGRGGGDRDNSWNRGGRQWEDRRRGYQDYGGGYRGYRDREDHRHGPRDYNSYQQRPRRDY
uniref:Protein containing RAM domain n=1 Tax=Rhipicephalus zambeziensis TaxID=60191 RepID=A0A224YYS1_9ACAR